VQFGRGVSGGEGVQVDARAAVGCFRKAAELGQVDAMGNLGVAFLGGVGVPVDARAAVAWLRKAAELGEVNAMHNLGVMLASGVGVGRADGAARRWWVVKAAALGHRAAQRALAERR
jgi:TPR repeat protein